MTEQDTRQLGIEFERRVQQMMPQKEFLDKLDTETIYSFLNQYQDKLVHELFNVVGNLQEDQQIPARVDILLKPLLKSESLVQVVQGRDSLWKLPNDKSPMAQYIYSTSTVSSYYQKGKDTYTLNPNQTIQNKFVTDADLTKYTPAPNDSLRIMRTPVISFSGIDNRDSLFTIIHDMYTTITGVQLTYYKNPQYFTILGEAKECELPIDLFDDLVSGAVALYMQYVVGQNKQDKKEDKENQS